MTSATATTTLPDELVLGSEELETLLHVLGDAAALPGRLAPTWHDGHSEYTEAIRRTAAHSLLARGLVLRVAGAVPGVRGVPDKQYQVEPSLAALLAVPTRGGIGYEFDLERGGAVTSGAVSTNGQHSVLVLPRGDGTVLLRSVQPDELATAVVDVAGSARPGPVSLDLPRRVLAEPLPSTEHDVLTGRGLSDADATALSGLLDARTGSGRVLAVRHSNLESGDLPGVNGTAGWVSSPLPVAWWDTTDGRYLVESVPGGDNGERVITVRGCTDFELRSALAELATGVM